MPKLAKSTIRVAVPLCMLLALAGRAQASPILFDALGNFSDGSMLTGTVTIDTATDQLTAMDLTVAGGTSFSGPSLEFFTNLTQADQQGTSANETWLGASTLNNAWQFQLVLPVPNLLSYTGGPIIGSVAPPFGTPSNFSAFGEGGSQLLSGTLTEDVSTTPEPPTIVMLSMGLLTIGGFYFVRRRRGTADSIPVC
jgi:hypothetical protein